MDPRTCRAHGLFAAPTLATVLFLTGMVQAQQSGALDIEVKPVPGQLDLLQGTAIQLGGKPAEEGPVPTSYRWEILEGEGGRLLKADEPEAVFQAPTIEKDVVLFILKLTVEYEGQQPAEARLTIRVHRKPPERDFKDELDEYYNRRAQQQRYKTGGGTTVVVPKSPYPRWRFGFGFGWGSGWPISYPIYVPIVCPPPGGNLGPGDGGWLEPTPLPYDELVTTFPQDIADDYLPQDHPLAEDIPAFGGIGDGPGDFITPPPGFDGLGDGLQAMPFDAPGLDLGGLDAPMIDPGLGGGGFEAPMIDPSFAVDDFGW